LKELKLLEGVWIKKPEDSQDSKDEMFFGSRSQEYGQGTEGQVVFELKDQVILIEWKNPYTGKNHYRGVMMKSNDYNVYCEKNQLELPAERIVLKIEGGGGNNSQVEFTIN